MLAPKINSLSIINDNETVDIKPFNLIPPINNDFTHTDIMIDDHQVNTTNELLNNLYFPTDSRPPPEPPPAFPNITFDTTTPILNKLRNNPNAFCSLASPLYLTCTTSTSNNKHSCDHVLEANAMLSSINSSSNPKPPLLETKPETTDYFYPLMHAQHELLNVLRHLDTVDTINTLNDNASTRHLTCSNTIMLMQARQIDGGEG